MLRGVPYSTCKLFFDGARDLSVGDYLLTPGGSAYLVQSIRQNRNRAYRKHLECLRWPKAEIPAGVRVHALHWYRREKRAARSLQSLRP
jgi:hypothetical protein